MQQSGFITRKDGIRLAFEHLAGRGPTLVFLPGLRSDMQGSKALDLLAFCAERGQAMLRLDYSGHGASDGAFEAGCIGEWAADAAAVIAARVSGPMVLVGSSMGGWIGLLLARQPGAQIAGYVGIAAAPDFTERLMWAAMGPQERDILLSQGALRVPSEYGEDMVITRKLIEDGRGQLVLDDPLPLPCPVRLLQGQQDPDVPWELALTLAAHVESPDVQTILIATLTPLLGED